MLLELGLDPTAVRSFGGMGSIVLNVTLPPATATTTTTGASAAGDEEGASEGTMEDTVELTLSWKNKTATRLAESTWLSFEPRVPQPNAGWRLDVMGHPVDPLSVVYNGSRHFHAVQYIGLHDAPRYTLDLYTLHTLHTLYTHYIHYSHFKRHFAREPDLVALFRVYVVHINLIHTTPKVHRGVCYDDAQHTRLAIDTLDTPFVAPGDTAHLIDFDNKLPDLNGGMHFNLHNNAGWDASGPWWCDQDAMFRFRIRLNAPQGCW
jgi:hypothetical protein